MKSKSSHYILTGSTGILGSHILYELLKEIHDQQYEGSVLVLIRSRKEKNSFQRFMELFQENVAPSFLSELDLPRLIANHIRVIDIDIRNTFEATQLLRKEQRYHLIHCAASVNLGSNAGSEDEIRHVNYLGSINLVHGFLKQLHKITYISTAFSTGHRNGVISENYLQQSSTDYRNPYEAYKAKTEWEIKQIAEAHGIAWQVVRPSIICGRLMDHPHHVIPKFLVFYLFGAFFLKAKAAYGHMPIRILMNQHSGLNIIPVDYAAKAITRALALPIQELTVANKACIPNIYTVPTMLEQVGWKQYEFVDQVPGDLNALEKLYYRTVGPQLNEYLQTPAYEFDVTTLLKLMEDLEEPDVKASYMELVNYAVEREFMHVLA
ncbi:MAG: SDR family oxidoreductase [Cytophagaceae bacterium]|jgi:nucleoside-diphosphate-sugar epimerase|nr:SDR family oxidoreductase [Cytophagaceae bacterium]